MRRLCFRGSLGKNDLCLFILIFVMWEYLGLWAILEGLGGCCNKNYCRLDETKMACKTY